MDDLGCIAALGDPHIAVGWVRVSLALKGDRLPRVDGKHLPCAQALARVHLKVVRAICVGKRRVRETWQFAVEMFCW